MTAMFGLDLMVGKMRAMGLGLGQKSEVVVKNQKVQKNFKVFIRYPDGMSREYDFCVEPGDLVSCYLWVMPPRKQSKHPNYPQIGVCIVDHSSGERMFDSWFISQPLYLATAEWIVSRPDSKKRVKSCIGPERRSSVLPNYGATFFHRTSALSGPELYCPMLGFWARVQEQTVNKGQLAQMTVEFTSDTTSYKPRTAESIPDPGKVISTAELLTTNVLLVYAYNDECEQEK